MVERAKISLPLPPASSILPAILLLRVRRSRYAVAAEGLGVTVHAGEWVNQGNEGKDLAD